MTTRAHGALRVATVRPTRFGMAAVVLAVSLLTTVSGRVAMAQSSRLRLPERLGPATRVLIEAVADSLAAEGLPAAAVGDKAAEGALKGANDERIVAAVRALAQRLRRSRQLLGADAGDDALLAAASALYAGVPPASISRLARIANDGKSTHSGAALAMSLTVMAELAGARVPLDVAVTSLEQLLARGAGDADLRAFRNGVDVDIRRGLSPSDAASAGVQRTLRGLGRVP